MLDARVEEPYSRRPPRPAGRRRRMLRRDLAGNMHIVEVMIVGLLIAGAMVAVNTLQQPSGDVTSELREGERTAQDFLGLYAVLPPESTSVHYSHRLEELVVEHLRGDDPTLIQLLGVHGFANPRLYVEADGRTRDVTGFVAPPGSGSSLGGSTFWHSDMGATIISPMLSVHDPSMPVLFEVLPVAMHRMPEPPGMPYEVRVGLLQDGVLVEHGARLHARAPLDGQLAVRIDPVSATGAIKHTFEQAEVETGAGYLWDLRFRVTPLPPDDRNWLDDRTVLRFERPPGWSATLEDPGNWTLVGDAAEPIWRMEYAGRPYRGPGEAWLNLTLERPLSDPLRLHEHVALRQESPGWSEASVVLSPDAAQGRTPPLVLVSQPGPLPVEDATAMRFTLTNPADLPATMDGLEVRFPGLSHQFRHEPADWSRVVDGTSAVYRYVGPAVEIPASGAKTLTLPMKVQKQEGDHMRAVSPPVVEYLGPGALQPPHRDGLLAPPPGGEVPSFVAVPSRLDGTYLARLWVDGLSAGPHTVRVGGDTASRLPPGVLTFELVDFGAGALDDLQAARHTMGVDVDKQLMGYRDELALSLRLGSLPEFFAGATTGDDVRVRVTAGDLVSYVSGRPLYDETHEYTVAEFLSADPFVVPALPSAFPGPLVVTLDVTVDLEGAIGEVDLRFITYAFRTAHGAAVNPVFMNAHLQYWERGVQGAP